MYQPTDDFKDHLELWTHTVTIHHYNDRLLIVISMAMPFIIKKHYNTKLFSTHHEY